MAHTNALPSDPRKTSSEGFMGLGIIEGFYRVGLMGLGIIEGFYRGSTGLGDEGLGFRHQGFRSGVSDSGTQGAVSFVALLLNLCRV